MAEIKAKVNEKAMAVFTKEQLKRSRRYRKEVDIVDVVLQDGKSYSSDEVDKLIKKFKESKVI